LAEAIRELPVPAHPNLLVGYNTADDAGVYRISDELALVQTVDFFPPIVDDPYQFGQIAAANALSDIYAMGGRPLTALNILCFPSSSMSAEIMTEVLRGGSEKVEEAGAVVVGGHSVKDKELKYGVAVTGIVHPDRIKTNAGARAGDRLYLTKPLGTGLITTGIKNNLVGDDLVQLVTRQMAQLNRQAAELATEFEAHAVTDITGYGLLGHSLEIAQASGVTVRILAGALPLMPRAIELAQAGMIPGGAVANRDFVQSHAAIADTVDENLVHVMFDPQTSGGLLIAVAPERAEQLETAAAERHILAQRIGRAEAPGETHIVVE
jgi:selenide,water dikinase